MFQLATTVALFSATAASAFVVKPSSCWTAPTQQHGAPRRPAAGRASSPLAPSRLATRASTSVFSSPSLHRSSSLAMMMSTAEVVEASVVGEEFEVKTDLLKQIDLSSSKQMRFVQI